MAVELIDWLCNKFMLSCGFIPPTTKSSSQIFLLVPSSDDKNDLGLVCPMQFPFSRHHPSSSQETDTGLEAQEALLLFRLTDAG